MELDMFEILLSHGQDITAVGEEDVTTLSVLGHILVLTLLEVLHLGLVTGFTLYPASLVEADGLPTALGIVLVLETILNNLELQLTYRTDDLAAIELIDKQLGDTLVHQLIDTLLQLLGLHGISILDVLEHLG